jgi:8-oxo-dGTP pyrophosphatase MutT (NUDIX family)
MDFTQRIYYNDKPIILQTATENAGVAADNTNYCMYSGLSVAKVIDCLAQLEHATTTGAIFDVADVPLAFADLLDMYQVVPAGGGLVYNDAGHLLLIFRRGKWDLPKGKQDEDESIADCAVREVQEETGLKTLLLGSRIGETWHIYKEKGVHKIKHSTWYHLTHVGDDALVPQHEEDIEQAIWVAPDALAPYMANSYQAIQEIMRTAAHSW